MAITFLAGDSGIPDDDNPTTGAIDTTGASLICVIACHELGTGTISDSAGNTGWTPITVADTTSPARTVLGWYKEAPTTSATHTFTLSGTQIFGSIGVLAFAGTATSSALDQQETTFTNGATSLEGNGITPSEAGEVVVVMAGAAGDDVTGITTGTAGGNGFTLVDHAASSGNGDGNAVAYQIQTTATVADPKFTWANSDRLSMVTLSFKAAATGSSSVSPSVSPSASVSPSPSPSAAVLTIIGRNVLDYD